MSQAVAALIGALIGGVFALVGGLVLQWRAERRRMLGAGRVVCEELKRNASSVEFYFERTEGSLAGRKALVHFALQIETRGWDTHNAELSHLVDDDLLNDLERLYYYLRRLEQEPSISPNWADRLRDAEGRLRARIKRTWWDRHIWRL